MSKKTLIIIEFVLIIIIGLFAFVQKIEADKQRDRAVVAQTQTEEQRDIAIEQKAFTDTAQIEAMNAKDMTATFKEL